MTTALILLGVLSLFVWLGLLFFRHGYWRADQRLEAGCGPEPPTWPTVTAVVPARNEADVVAAGIDGLLTQDYPGRFRVVLVDDHSDDRTAARAREAAREAGRELDIVLAGARPADWTGKLFAMSEGVRRAGNGTTYLWFTDADIRHDPGVLRALVARAESRGADLVSTMVLLSSASFWERLLIPPFVYFFQKLYPFRAVNDPRSPIAAAAGGSMLVRRSRLEAAGGLAAIARALIDDCALGRLVKANGGRLWLGLTTSSRSIRPYRGLGDIWRMVSRSAYTQLDHSPLKLAGTVLGMIVTYAGPPAAGLGLIALGAPLAALPALAAWALMVTSALPTMRLYGQSWGTALALPAAAALYVAMTVDSARAHWRGHGGTWKGRTEGGLARS